MLIALKSLLHTLLLPPGGPLLLAAVGAGLIRWHPGARARRAGWALLVASLATLWLLATPLVAAALQRVVQRYPALDLSQPVRAQAIVILGGVASREVAPEYGGGPAVAAGLLERIAYGAYVAQHTGLPVLVSGEEHEVLAMRDSLSRNFHLETRWVEGQSHDTFQNAMLSARILKAAGVSRVVLVTDGDHEWRAVQEFESAGLGVVPAPEGLWTPPLHPRHGPLGFVPNPAALEQSTVAISELIGNAVRATLAALHLRRQAP
jgi:uncharacterized SAM-binding protein YcdF (DUF218 family)